MIVRNLQKHIRIHIHPVAEKAVCLITSVFKITFIFRIPGGVNAVAAPDQNDGEPVLGRHPDHAFMAVDEPVLPFRKLGGELPAFSHHHQFMVRAAETDNDRLNRNSLFFRFAPETPAGRIDQVHFSVNQGMVRIVPEKGSEYFLLTHGLSPPG